MHFPVIFFCRTSAEDVLRMSRNQNWSFLRQNNSKSIWQVSNKPKLLHLYQINRSGVSSALVLYKKYLFTKSGQNQHWMKKKSFLAFSHFNNFLLLTVTYRLYLIFKIWIYLDYHIAKAPSILKHTFKVWKPKHTLILYHGKDKETYFTSVKKANIL